VNLAKRKIGEDSAALLDALLGSSVGITALSRADAPEERRRDSFVYLDEFATLTTVSPATMLSELRQYRGSLVLTHQYLSQVNLQVRNAILRNVRTVVAFRLGLADAEVLEKKFLTEFGVGELTRLPDYNIYLKLRVYGAATEPFSGETLEPFD